MAVDRRIGQILVDKAPRGPFGLPALDRRNNIGISGGKRASDKSSALHCGPMVIDGRLDMPKADGVVA